MAIVNFQKEILKHAFNAWDRFPLGEITMHTATLCMSEELVETIRQEMRKFRRKLLRIVGNEKKPPERVYSLSLSFFPMSTSAKKE